MLRFFKKYNKDKVKNLLIIGAPKSGTTALLYTLKKALGESEVTEYFEPTQLEVINRAITKKKLSVTKVVALKKIESESVTNFSKTILIPRDPRDQFISSMLYEAAYHALWNTDEALILDFYRILREKSERPSEINCIDIWGKYITNSLSLDEFVQRNEYLRSFYNSSEAFVIKYEDFVNKNFENIEKYLDLNLNEDAEVPSKFKRVIRTKGYGGWKDWLTNADLEFFKEKFSNYYRDFGYHDLDWSLENNEIDKEYSSGYFLKTVNDKRKQEGLSQIAL